MTIWWYHCLVSHLALDLDALNCSDDSDRLPGRCSRADFCRALPSSKRAPKLMRGKWRQTRRVGGCWLRLSGRHGFPRCSRSVFFCRSGAFDFWLVLRFCERAFSVCFHCYYTVLRAATSFARWCVYVCFRGSRLARRWQSYCATIKNHHVAIIAQMQNLFICCIYARIVMLFPSKKASAIWFSSLLDFRSGNILSPQPPLISVRRTVRVCFLRTAMIMLTRSRGYYSVIMFCSSSCDSVKLLLDDCLCCLRRGRARRVRSSCCTRRRASTIDCEWLRPVVTRTPTFSTVLSYCCTRMYI